MPREWINLTLIKTMKLGMVADVKPHSRAAGNRESASVAETRVINRNVGTLFPFNPVKQQDISWPFKTGFCQRVREAARHTSLMLA